MVMIFTTPPMLNAQSSLSRLPPYPRIKIDGEWLNIPDGEQQAVNINGRVMIPLRAVSEALGLSVDWNVQTRTATLEGAGQNVIVQVGSYDMNVNGDTVPLDVPAQIINSRTMLPVRAISEATGFEVRWDNLNRIVHILPPITIDHWPAHLPQYTPGDITLHSSGEQLLFQDLSKPMQFRYVFYGVPGKLQALVGMMDSYYWLENEWHRAEDTMILMHFVKHFNISREDFDDAIESRRAFSLQMGYDLTDEEHELPNADIIYTFDEDIIRYYYRRE